ncbi:phage tail family protein [Lysinibacillus sp. FSL W8-0953]|uniref:phage tail family protein n=1 Tax=Lysinibacillus sp. FSL W8-0953 TaxID=2954640 RepID=UPI0030F8E3CE
MIANTITFTNLGGNGDSVNFAPNRHFRLINGFDLSALSATVNQSQSTKNGATYQSTKLESRDFDIEFFIYRNSESINWYEEKRHELFKVFNPLKNPIRIDFVTKGGKEYYIDAELVATPSLPQGWENDNNTWQKGLLQFNASDPFIYEKNEIKTDIALWMANLEFPLEVFEEGIEIGYRSPSLIVNVQNNGSDDTGMIIRFKAASEVVNPKLLNVNTYEELKLNFTMLPGDLIEISTFSGKRTAVLTRNNVKTNIFGKIDLSSTFLQLRVGDNLFRYDVDKGLDYLECSILHRNTLIGV